MLGRNLTDLIIGCLLVSTLGIAVFMVSCSEQEGVNNASLNTVDEYRPHQHRIGIASSALTSAFASVGRGAASEVGSVGMGWLLGAMGLTTSSGPDWQAEFNKINDDLNQIISLLNDIDQELIAIENTLNQINCTLQQTSLQADLAAIKAEYLQYTTLMMTAAQGDTLSNAVMLNFANNVINGTGTQVSIANALSNIQVNAGQVIQGCLPLISKPANGTFGQDTTYYDQAHSLLNNYYYYQTIGLGLLSEAYHYKAWIAAGRPGGNQGYSSDSVQMVCSANSNAAIECNTVINQSNAVYNILLTQFKLTGAPYTGSDLLYQKNTSGQELVWVKSLEDYTIQSGANCNYPLTSVSVAQGVDPTCGPTAGIVGSAFSFTTYHGTQNFQKPRLQYLNGLVDPLPDIGSSPIYTYLESLGFESMNNKILIADTLVFIKSTVSNGWYFIDTMHVVPFIFNALKEYTNHDGNKRAIYSTTSDFLVAMYATSSTNISSSACAESIAPAKKVNWTASLAPPVWGLAGGYIQFCEYTQFNPPEYVATIPFTWNSKSTAPGWSYYAVNANPQRAYFLPVKSNFSGSTGCLPGYNNLNSAGFITKCGSDLQDYLIANLPIPPTCAIQNSTPCTRLP